MAAEARLAEREGPPQSPRSGSIDPSWAWAAYKPDAARPWNLRWAGHLYRRAAFGASWKQLQQAVADGPQRTIDRLLKPEADAEKFNRDFDNLEAGAVETDSASTDVLCQWWLRRLVETPQPLLERMTLFWHGYFAANGGRVQRAQAMQHHVQLLRGQALGRFSTLLEGVVREPAMLVSLDLGVNARAQPSEALARPLLELFTVGPGAYSDRDVRETARAFTGWSVVRRQVRYFDDQHDPLPKSLFGQQGPFSGADAVRIILQQPATARNLVRRLYRWLVAETEPPSDALLAPLAESFAKDYDVATLVATVLRSNLFFSPTAYRQRVRGPVEFALGLVRPLEAVIPTTALVHDLAELGQDLGRPPTVHGWEGGRSWITNFTLLGRNNLAAALLAGSGPYGNKLDPQAVAARHGCRSPEAAARFLLDLLLQGDVEAGVREKLLAAAPGSFSEAGAASWLRRLCREIATLPEFQLS